MFCMFFSLHLLFLESEAGEADVGGKMRSSLIVSCEDPPPHTHTTRFLRC